MIKRKNLIQITSIFMVLCLLVSIFNGTGVTVHANSDQQEASENVRTYSYGDSKLVFHVDNNYDNGFNATITIKNIGEDIFKNWCIKLDKIYQITNIWNAEILSLDDDSMTIRNADYNRNISAAGEVSFGFSSNEKFSGFPAGYSMVGAYEELDRDAYEVDYQVTSHWEEGFKGEVSITNKSDVTIEDWSLEALFDYEIIDIWNASIQAHRDSTYVFENAGYNSEIAPGESVIFGFTASGDALSSDLSRKKLASFDYTVNEEVCTISFEACCEDACVLPQEIKVKKGEKAVKPEYPIRDDYYFMGWYTDKAYEDYFDFHQAVIRGDMTLYARWISLSDKRDTDNDGWNDSVEDFIGTDKTKWDTDEDGLSDYFEVEQSNTNPTVFDTDENGVSDGDEDPDEDGLVNKEEADAETEVEEKDTDGDGVNDRKEVKVLHTNPLKEDTDNDSLKDGDELKMGLDPLKEDTDEDGVLDPDEVLAQKEEIDPKDQSEVITKVSVSMECKGSLSEQLSIENTMGIDILSSEVVGLVGCPVEINVSEKLEFDTANITFGYDDSKLGDTEEANLRVMWYDEEKDKYVLLEDSIVDVENNTVTYQTTHFSTYLVIDKKKWDGVLLNNNSLYGDIIEYLTSVLKGDENAAHEYKCYENAMTWEQAKAFCEKQGGHLVTITSETEQKIVESVVRAEGQKNNYWIGANREGNGAYTWVTGEASKYENWALGEPNNFNSHDEKYVHIIGKDYSQYKYRGVWNDSMNDGASYAGDFYALEHFGFICEWDKVNVKDSDLDGIMDIMEEGYMLSNGQLIQSDPTSKDTDKDGLSDAEEMGAEPELSNVKTEDGEVVVLVWHLASNPNKVDSDEDGLYDGSARCVEKEEVAPKDPEPNKKNAPDGLWDSHVMQQEIGAVATEYDYSKPENELEELTAMIRTAVVELDRIENEDEVVDMIVDVLLDGRAIVGAAVDLVTNEEEKKALLDNIKKILMVVKFFSEGNIREELGAAILNFIPDDKGIAYHSQIETWQRDFGYNHLYDEVFDFSSKIHYLPINFSVDGVKY